MVCALSGRMDKGKEAKGFGCEFKPYFEALLALALAMLGMAAPRASTGLNLTATLSSSRHPPQKNVFVRIWLN